MGGYSDAGLTDEEVEAFLAKYNRVAVRKCISCSKPFESPGAHIRKCQECKNKEYANSQKHADFEPSFACKSHAPGMPIPKDTDSELIRGLVTAWLPF